MIYIDVLKRINEDKINYVVVGMMGAIMQGMDITTSDIDILVDMDRDKLRRIAEMLKSIGFTIPEGMNTMDDKSMDIFITQAKNGHPIVFYDFYSCVTVEILWAIDGFSHKDALERAKIVEWEGIPVKVLDIEDIAKSKEIANRPKDKAVLPRLKEVIEEINRLGLSKNQIYNIDESATDATGCGESATDNPEEVMKRMIIFPPFPLL